MADRNESLTMVVSPLSLVDTTVTIVMENRSFDHVLGHLSVDSPSHIPVEGVKTAPVWQAARANQYSGKTYSSYLVAADYAISEPKHDRESMITQIELP